MLTVQRTSTLVFLLCFIMGLEASLHTTSIGATGHGATRHFSDVWISPGTDLVVTITATGYGTFGQIAETLPEGFNYKETSLEVGPKEEGQTLFFTLLGDDTFTYTVMVPGEEKVYRFFGMLKDSDKDERPVGGLAEVTISSTPHQLRHSHRCRRPHLPLCPRRVPLQLLPQCPRQSPLLGQR